MNKEQLIEIIDSEIKTISIRTKEIYKKISNLSEGWSWEEIHEMEMESRLNNKLERYLTSLLLKLHLPN